MSKNPADGIMTLEEAKAWRARLRREGKRLVVTNGCFDLLHRGHAEYLYESREFIRVLFRSFTRAGSSATPC